MATPPVTTPGSAEGLGAAPAFWSSEDGFRQIVESTHEGVWVLDTQGVTVYANRQMAALLGYTPEEMTGRSAFDFVWPEDVDRGTREWELRRAGAEGRQSEYRYRHKDGRAVWCLASSSVLRDAEGRTVGVLGMFADITERKRAEEALRESEQRYRSLFNSMSEGCVVGRIIYDAGGRPCDYQFVEANPAYERLTGLSRELSLRKTMKELIPTLEPVWVERHARVAETGVAERWEAYNEHVGQYYEMYSFSPGPGLFASVFFNVTDRKRSEEAAKDGTPVDITWANVRLPDGWSIGIGIDVRARPAMEAAVQKQARMLEAIMEHVPEGIAICDVDGRFVMSSRVGRALTRRAPGDDAAAFLGKNRLFEPDGVTVKTPDEAPLMRAVRRGEVVMSEELLLEREDGTRIPILANAAPIWDEQGAIAGAVLAYQDISGRKRMEDDLRESDRRKDEFIAILSHELRNPLAPIRYALPVLQQERLTDPGIRALAVVGRQVDHLTRLVDDLLDVSRITRGKIELRQEYVTLGAIVTASVEAASPAVAAASHTLSLQVSEEPIWLHADPARMAQIVTNLLDNSAKYTPRGGQIVLEAGREDGQAVIRVRDNGMGIAADSLPKIFEMFLQVNRPEGQAGLGIGLALVQRLLEMHGGTIEARSAGAGRGSEFVVRVPVAEEARAAESQEVAVTTNGGARLRVLVVDDNEDLAEMLAMLIEAAGHDVRKAFDGPSAVAAALAYRPNVALLDLGLPGASGIEVATELRRHPETAHARLIALTGWGQVEDRRRTKDAGFDHHLTKPADPERLERLLADIALDMRRAEGTGA